MALGAAVSAALALCLLALLAAQPAGAAFPGTNGKIAYNRALDYWAQNAAPGSPETKLMDTAANLAFSPDGSHVAFMRSNEIFVANADGSGTPRNITNSPLLDWNPVWSHDGTRISFVRRGSDNVFNIWTMKADGTEPTQLTTQASTMPAWSVPTVGAPDGRIAFMREGRIWTMLPDGTGQAELPIGSCPTENGGVCDTGYGNPTFSPDGSQIAADYFGDVFVVPSVGGTARVILGTPEDGYPGQELDPTWSPDGTKIAFEHNGNVGGSAYGIYTANADGSSAQALQVTAKTGEVDPDWQQDSVRPTVKKVSPTGRRVSPKVNATATFSEAMDPATLDGTTFRLVKKGSTKALAATVTYSAATAKATLNPARNLKSGATYKATVAAGAEDAAGNALVAKTWGFKVR